MGKQKHEITPRAMEWILSWADHCFLTFTKLEPTDVGRYGWTKHDQTIYDIVKDEMRQYYKRKK